METASCACGKPELQCTICCPPSHGRPPHHGPPHHRPPHHGPPHHRPPHHPGAPPSGPGNDGQCPPNCPNHPPNQCPTPPFRPPERPHLPAGNDCQCPPQNCPNHPPNQCPPSNFPPMRPPERPYLPPSDWQCPPQNCPHHPPNQCPSCPQPGNESGGYTWIDICGASNIPPSAFCGGHDIDGQPIYVGRASHSGDLLPAKVIPGHNAAYVSYNGKDIAVQNLQVLTEHPRFRWVTNRGKNIPPGAIEGGRTKTGEPLYVGRVQHQNSLTVGKVHPSHGTCYIAFGGKEIGYPDYEILVL